MAVPTEPRQPVVYDMMLLADSLLNLRRFRGVRQRHPDYCERQKNFEVALTKIRCLAQFLSAPRSGDLLTITHPAFGGTPDKSFMKELFDRISRYVSHLHEQRYRKEKKYPRPKERDARTAGKRILKKMKPILDRDKDTLKGDAAHWYTVFEGRYRRLYD